MIYANAATTLLDCMTCKKFSGFEPDSNPGPLRYRCNALPTELSKPHWLTFQVTVEASLHSLRLQLRRLQVNSDQMEPAVTSVQSQFTLLKGR